MSDENGNYEVGYKKPPKGHRFQKGKPSANPNGRPKNIRDPIELLSRQLYRQMKITENGKVVSIRAIEALVKSMVLNDIKKGSDRTFKLYLEAIKHQMPSGKFGAPKLVKLIVDDIAKPLSKEERSQFIKEMNLQNPDSHL